MPLIIHFPRYAAIQRHSVPYKLFSVGGFLFDPGEKVQGAPMPRGILGRR